MRRQIVFVSGRYRAKTLLGRLLNIWKARKAAIKLWQMGYTTFCPHLNTLLFDGHSPDDVWLKGDIKILKHCQIIYMMKNWEKSEGACTEFDVATEHGLRIWIEGEDEPKRTPVDSPYICGLCRAEFNNITQLSEHLETHSLNEVDIKQNDLSKAETQTITSVGELSL